MTARLISKFKSCKNVRGLTKNLWGVVKSINFRSIRILKQNFFNIKQKLSRLSAFGKYLNTKKCLKVFYCNFLEKHFKVLLKKSIISKYKTSDKVISFLESRPNVVLYRSRFVNSLYTAKSYINHGFVYLNSKKLTLKNLTLKAGDILELKSNHVHFKQIILGALKQRAFKQGYKVITNKLYNKKYKIRHIMKLLNNKNRVLTRLLKKILIKKQTFLIKKLTKVPILAKNIETSLFLLKVIFLWDPLLLNVYYPVAVKYKQHNDSFIYSFNELLYKQ